MFASTPQSIRLAAYCQLPGRGAFWCVQPPPKSCPPFTGKVDTNECEWPKGERFKNAKLSYCSPSASLALSSSPVSRWRLLGDTMCQDIRVNALVGTRSPYSLPFAILPVPARSPFRFIRHWRRSTPNLTRRKADFTWRSHISHCKSNISPVRKNGFHRA